MNTVLEALEACLEDDGQVNIIARADGIMGLRRTYGGGPVGNPNPSVHYRDMAVVPSVLKQSVLGADETLAMGIRRHLLGEGE